MEEFVFVLLGFGVMAVFFFSLRDWGDGRTLLSLGTAQALPES